MKTEETLINSITEINLSYLILAQQMLRADKATALYRLGIPEQVADLIDTLRPSQLLKIAQTGSLVCQIRSSDTMVWDLLASHATKDGIAQDGSADRLHARVLLAGKHSEVI